VHPQYGRTVRKLPVIALLILAPSLVGAQTASAAAKAFLQAHTEGKWDVMAELIDSTSIRSVRVVAQRLLTQMAMIESSPSRDAADSTGLGSLLQGVRSMMGNFNVLQMTFARVMNDAQVNTLSDRELMARWLEAKSPGYSAELTARMMQSMMRSMPPGSEDEVNAALEAMGSKTVAWEVVGEVLEGDTLAHVTYRVAGRTTPAPTGVLTFARTGGRWLVHFASPDDQLTTMSTLATR
jgi:hypothetical protein